MKPKHWRPELIALIAAAFATRFWNLFQPNAVVFDEVYFKAFAGHYLDGHYFFDIHPPLGKLLLAGWAHLIHLAPSSMLGGTAVQLRLLPALAGTLLIPLLWGILRRLGASRAFAALGASLILLDNAFTTESRFILMDSMLLLFGLGALYWHLVARDHTGRRRWSFLALATASAGAAASIKWTGLTALALVGLIWLLDQFRPSAKPTKTTAKPAGRTIWPRRLGEAALFIVIPATIYLSAFAVHFHLLPHSGDGDAFMSAEFQQTLIDSPYYNSTTKLSFWNKFTQLNVEMYKANQTLTATHPYGSSWYTWPLEQRPIYYWEGDQLAGGQQGNIYLLGNPVIWWGIWIAICAGLINTGLRGRQLRPTTVAALAIAGTAYIINYLPFVAVTRVMFLYHYFFSFVFSLIFAIMLWNDIATDRHGHQLTTPRQRYVYGAILGLIAFGFLYFSPLTYGTPLTPTQLQAHMWLKTWR